MKITPIRYNGYKINQNNNQYRNTTSPARTSFKAQDNIQDGNDVLSSFFKLQIKPNYKNLIIENFKTKEIITAYKRGLFDTDIFNAIEKTPKLLSVNTPIFINNLASYHNESLMQYLKKIKKLCEYSDDNWKKLIELNLTPKNIVIANIPAEGLEKVLNFPIEKQQRLASFLNNKQRPISVDDAIIFSDMPEKNFEKIKDLFYFKTGETIHPENTSKTKPNFLDTNILVSLSKHSISKINEFKDILTTYESDCIGLNTPKVLLKLIDNKKDFEKFKERNLSSEKGPLLNKVPINFLNKFIKMSDEDFSNYTKLSNELYKNRNLLKDYDGQPANDIMIKYIILSNFEPITARLVEPKVLKHAMGLGLNNFTAFLNSVKKLEVFDKNLQDNIFDKINKLTYPEQKMNKLLILSNLSMYYNSDSAYNNYNNYKTKINNQPNKQPLIEVLDYIIPTKATQEQLDLAKKIFSDNTKNNEENIQTFFDKFSVPEKSKATLHKFFTPMSVEKQINDIEKMIENIESDTELSPEKKTKQLAQLKHTKQKMIQNPSEFQRFIPTKSNMQKLSAYIESHINIPHNDRDVYNYLYKYLYSLFKVEVSDELKQKLNFNEKDLSELFKQKNRQNYEFNSKFKELLLLLNQDTSKSLSELRESLPQNKITKRYFEKNGLNYGKWIKFDKNLKKEIKLVSNGQEKSYALRLSDDDNISRNLFFGNHVDCCTAINRINSYSAPLYLINTSIRGLELVDESEDSYGNSMCYFANIEDNDAPGKEQLVFVIDSFIANNDLYKNKKLTKELFEFGKIVASEMGRPDAKIILGTRNNRLEISELEQHITDDIELIGSERPYMYLDFCTSTPDLLHSSPYYEYPDY